MSHSSRTCSAHIQCSAHVFTHVFTHMQCTHTLQSSQIPSLILPYLIFRGCHVFLGAIPPRIGTTDISHEMNVDKTCTSAVFFSRKCVPPPSARPGLNGQNDVHHNDEGGPPCLDGDAWGEQPQQGLAPSMLESLPLDCYQESRMQLNSQVTRGWVCVRFAWTRLWSPSPHTRL